MERMTTLINKTFRIYGFYLVIIMLICFPLFYYLMKYSYTEDLDELIEYRIENFITNQLSGLSVSEIDLWNKYNDDLTIIPGNDAYRTDKCTEEYLFNKAEGHNIYYRVIYKNIMIENTQFAAVSRTAMIESKDLMFNLSMQYLLDRKSVV